MSTIFELPDELLATLIESFPCRDVQIRALATLLYPRAAPCRNLIIHGTEATGKSAITASLLKALRDESPAADLFNYAIVKSAECVTARHLFERTVGSVADALQWEGASVGRCETLAALTVELTKMLKYAERDAGWRFVLVFDGIDRQREAPPTLLPALARLSEIIPNLTTLFLLTTPAPSLLRTASTPQLYFAPYTKAQYTTILSLQPPPPPFPLPNTSAQETADLWTRFAGAVHDALARPASRTLPRLRAACEALWPRFTAPVGAGTLRAREFSKLLIAARACFQDEGVLEPGIALRVRDPLGPGSSNSISNGGGNGNGNANGKGAPTTTPTPTPTPKKNPSTNTSTTDLATLLPPTARLLLIAAYLASHNPPRHDQLLFSTWHTGHKRRRGGGGGGSIGGGGGRGRRARHRKIARKLLGPSPFVLERMVAIYAATVREWVGGGADGEKTRIGVDGDVGMAMATLASLRLLVRVGGGGPSGGGAGAAMGGVGDLDRGGKWRVGVGWEVVRGVGRSMGVEVEEWLIE
ncbi:origin recognition complex subunit 5 C-terminus-domain-containing protein [Whalleya microplaca]|nr:origin recognition complex subunit 5 C-terminus-domain-containing protein [Whalleya microplaca]